MVSKGANIKQCGHMEANWLHTLEAGGACVANCPWQTQDSRIGFLESEEAATSLSVNNTSPYYIISPQAYMIGKVCTKEVLLSQNIIFCTP